MKERWAMRRTPNLMPGDVVWVGVVFTLTTVKPLMRMHIKGETTDGRGTIEAELPRDMYLPVKVVPLPPTLPKPPPLFIRDHGDNDSWWGRLKDWLNGR